MMDEIKNWFSEHLGPKKQSYDSATEREHKLMWIEEQKYNLARRVYLLESQVMPPQVLGIEDKGDC